MKKFYFIFRLLILTLLPFWGYGQKKPFQGAYEPNKLMVKFKTPAGVSSLGKSNRSTLKGITIIRQEPFLQPTITLKSDLQTQQGLDASGLNRVYEITYSAKKSIDQVIKDLMASGEVEYAEPLYLCYTDAVPNDQSYPLQYALPQVKAPEAWDIQPNSNGQVIAIIDSGSETDHPDLADNILLNVADPVDGIDNDGDGFTDNFQGWDFMGATSTSTGDNDPNVVGSAYDHGVHVSGIASAVTNNGIGVASIAQTAKLMILKAATDDDATTIYPSAAYKAMMYAIDKGVKIINCSWGRDGGPSAFEQNVIDYALSRGCLIVAAAGNSGTDTPEYPAAYNGVLAVSNLNADDIKSGMSSYGLHVAISAPGTSIYGTTYGRSYGYKTGTSMATPMVASAAALVAAHFPDFTGPQIGEILRSSTDDIYHLDGNANYRNQLGSGRLNALKALNVGSSPAIRKQEVQISDASGSFREGETVELRFLLKNFLQPATNVQLTLNSDNEWVQVLNPQADIGSLNTNEEKWSSYLNVRIKENIPENEEVIFRLSYQSEPEAYQSEEYFSLKLNRDFINYQVGEVQTTVTSSGRIGYQDATGTDGSGWKYKGHNLLYEASLMITSQNKLVNNTRTQDGDAADDFSKVQKATLEEDSTATFRALSVFDDSNSLQPLGLRVNHRHYVFANAQQEPYVIVEYDIKNASSSTFRELYAGIFSDWDVGESTKNNTAYLSDLRMSYTWSADNATDPYAGIKLLNNDSRSHYYPLSYMVTGNMLSDDNFTKSEKIQTLSSGIAANGLGESYGGLDVMCVTASGPYDIAAGASKRIAFALVSADNLDQLKEAAAAAQAAYQQISPVADEPDKFYVKTVYPNPVHVADAFTTLEVGLPESGNLKIELYNVIGQRASTVVNQEYIAGLHKIGVPVSELHTGVYYGVVYFNGKRKSVKFLVME